jgi:hypothetical protein
MFSPYIANFAWYIYIIGFALPLFIRFRPRIATPISPDLGEEETVITLAYNLDDFIYYYTDIGLTSPT